MSHDIAEDLAKTRWCPFARQTDKGYGSFNRVRYATADAQGQMVVDKNGWRVLGPAQPAGGCKCLGQACMAWVGQELGHCALCRK